MNSKFANNLLEIKPGGKRKAPGQENKNSLTILVEMYFFALLFNF
jgi:hypothetical protein